MDKWYWTLLLAFCCGGVLLFLRVVANEAWAIHRALEFLDAQQEEEAEIELQVLDGQPSDAPKLKGTSGAAPDAA